MLQAMLGGQSHREAMAGAGAKPAQEAKSEPASGDKTKAPIAPNTLNAEPTGDAHAGHDMNNL